MESACPPIKSLRVSRRRWDLFGFFGGGGFGLDYMFHIVFSCVLFSQHQDSPSMAWQLGSVICHFSSNFWRPFAEPHGNAVISQPKGKQSCSGIGNECWLTALATLASLTTLGLPEKLPLSIQTKKGVRLRQSQK